MDLTCHMCGMKADTFHLFRCIYTDNTDWYNVYGNGDNYTILKSFDYKHVGLVIVNLHSHTLFTQLEQYIDDCKSPQKWTEHNPVDIYSSRIWCGLKYSELTGLKRGK